MIVHKLVRLLANSLNVLTVKFVPSHVMVNALTYRAKLTIVVRRVKHATS